VFCDVVIHFSVFSGKFYLIVVWEECGRRLGGDWEETGRRLGVGSELGRSYAIVAFADFFIRC
jgi:hypothetical protein